MVRNRTRLTVLGAASLTLLGGLGLVCCTRSAGPGVTVAPSQTTDPEPPGQSESDPTAVPEQPAADAPSDDSQTPPVIDMETPEEPEPKTPRYLAIVEEIDAGREALVETRLTPPTKLELTTRNIKRLRVTREGLPLAANRSIVLRIDGQGIEWTRQYLSVELERSPAGDWTVVRTRPVEP